MVQRIGLEPRFHVRLSQPKRVSQVSLVDADLRSGLAIFGTASLVFTLGFWPLYLVLVTLDIPSFDPLAWLLDDERAAVRSAVAARRAFRANFYCLFLKLLGFLVCFNKWGNMPAKNRA